VFQHIPFFKKEAHEAEVCDSVPLAGPHMVTLIRSRLVLAIAIALALAPIADITCEVVCRSDRSASFPRAHPAADSHHVPQAEGADGTVEHCGTGDGTTAAKAASDHAAIRSLESSSGHHLCVHASPAVTKTAFRSATPARALVAAAVAPGRIAAPATRASIVHTVWPPGWSSAPASFRSPLRI
jgi:hypothetical protein